MIFVRSLLRLVILSALLTLTAASVALAHVVVTPEEVPAGEYAKLVVSVPTEEQVPTTEIRVEVPEGFTVSGVQPVPGWEYEFEEEGGVITAITWSGGQIQPREFQEFAMQAQAPDETGEFSWRAIQTYEDGTVVEWTGPEDSETPASVVRVVAGGAGDHSDGAEEAGTRSEAKTAGSLPDSGGGRPAVYYGGLGACVLALAALVAALLRRRA